MASNRLDSELYYLVAKFLETGPCHHSAQLLRQEIEDKGLLPKRLDWTGAEHSTTFADIDRHNTHISANHLKKIVERINVLLDGVVPPSIAGVSSLLGDGRQSLLRNAKSVTRFGPKTSYQLSAFRNGCQMLPSSAVLPFHPPNLALSVISRENSGTLSQRQLLPTKCYDRYIRYRRLLGHLSSVYCVSFDRTGRYIFTGADDSLVKIWSAIDGRLLSTLRGHIKEITDLTINFENTLIAAGSCDTMIRVWCLKTTAPITVLNGHNAAITSVKFCPLARDNNRYLVSTANDGCVCFWKYNTSNNDFLPKPIKFCERHKPGSQLVCTSFSAGGVFLAIGSTDNYLRVYHITAPVGPTKILEIEQHSDTVDSLQFSNLSTRFVSGSKDGIAHIWYFERQHWHNIPLKMSERLPGSAPISEEISRKIRVSMVGWTCDDLYVITSLSDHSLKIWCSQTGQLKHVLYGHEDEVFVIEAHPKDSRLFLSGGHDGAIILWDVLTGTQIKHFFNGIDGQGHGAVFDCKFSPDGLMFASTDSHGHLSLFGMMSSTPYQKMPEQVFFHTDYRPVIRDSNHYAIDEQTQCAPHLMPPPFLVDIDGNPYPPNYQRLVPGRETCSDSQLVPYVAVHNANGNDVAEVLAPVEPIDPQSVPLGHAARPTIDDMIQRLQREQRRLNNEHDYTAHPSHEHRDVHNSPGRARHASGTQRTAGSRRAGTVEGVRQPINFMSRDRNLNQMVPVWAKKMVVNPLSQPELEKAKQRSLSIAETEESFFTKERRKRPQMEDASVNLKLAIKDGGERFTRRKRRIIQQRQGVRQSGGRERFPRRPEARHGITDYENPEDLSDDSDSDFTGDKEWADTSSDSDESEETEESEWDAPSTSRARRRHSSGSEEERGRSSDEPIPRPSKPMSKKEAKKFRERMKRRQYEEKYNAIQELPEKFRPPDWFTGVEPKKTPYFPQIGDEVVYFRSGHQHYIDKVREQHMYPTNPSLKPYKARGSQSDEVFARIEDIKYDVKPPRLVVLKLVMIDPENNELTSARFTVRYHDVEGVVDFIVLRRVYELSLERNWKVNDDFRSIIDDKWWFGSIETLKESEPQSHFQCFEVLWASGDRESLSPWDLEPIDEANLPPNRTLSVAVTDDEKRALNLCIDEDWPDYGREQECQRIYDGLVRIMDVSHAEDFLVPVDLNQHPVYGMMIAYPMDLTTIKQRLENHFYRRVDAVKFDANYIELNAQTFNESGSDIVKKAKLISALISQFIDDQLCFDPMEIYSRLVENYDQFSDPVDTEESREEEDSREVRRSSRRKRKRSGSESEASERQKPKKKKSRRESYFPRGWKHNCLDLLNYMLEREESTPFRTAVDPIQYPDYNQVIDTPMDLTTVKEQLLSDLYNNPNEFAKDMRLIFLNSKSYNTNKKSQIYSMTSKLSSTFEEGMRPIVSNWRSNIKYESNLKRGIVSNRRKPLPLSPIGSKRSPTKSSPTAKRRRRALSSSMSPTFDISLPSTSGYSSRSKSSQSNADKAVNDSKQKPKTNKADNHRKNGSNRSLSFRSSRGSTNGYKRKTSRKGISKRMGSKSSVRPKRNCRKRVRLLTEDSDEEVTEKEENVKVEEEDNQTCTEEEDNEEAIGSDAAQHLDSETEIEDEKSVRRSDRSDSDSDATEIEDETELIEEVEDLTHDIETQSRSLRQSYSEHSYQLSASRRTERVSAPVVRSKRDRLKASEDSELNQTSSASSSHSNYSNESQSSAHSTHSPAISDLASDQSSMSDENFKSLKRSQRTRRTSWRNRFESEDETDLRRVGLGLRKRRRGSDGGRGFPYLSESPKIKTRSRNSGKERVRYTFDDDDFEYDNVSGAHLNDAQSVSSRGRVRKFKAHAGVARLRH